jgi:hypothetical protein
MVFGVIKDWADAGKGVRSQQAIANATQANLILLPIILLPIELPFFFATD